MAPRNGIGEAGSSPSQSAHPCRYDVCEKKYATEQAWLNHVNMFHYGQFNCPESGCMMRGMNFRLGLNLLEHWVRDHNWKELYYPCPRCGTPFLGLKQRSDHVTNDHSSWLEDCCRDSNISGKPVKFWVCKLPDCPGKCKNFPSPAEFFRHYDDVHQNGVFSCPECGKIYSRRWKRKRHLIDDHGWSIGKEKSGPQTNTSSDTADSGVVVVQYSNPTGLPQIPQPYSERGPDPEFGRIQSDLTSDRLQHLPQTSQTSEASTLSVIDYIHGTYNPGFRTDLDPGLAQALENFGRAYAHPKFNARGLIGATGSRSEPYDLVQLGGAPVASPSLPSTDVESHAQTEPPMQTTSMSAFPSFMAMPSNNHHFQLREAYHRAREENALRIREIFRIAGELAVGNMNHVVNEMTRMRISPDICPYRIGFESGIESLQEQLTRTFNPIGRRQSSAYGPSANLNEFVYSNKRH